MVVSLPLTAESAVSPGSSDDRLVERNIINAVEGSDAVRARIIVVVPPRTEGQLGSVIFGIGGEPAQPAVLRGPR
jgi:hypothetical protein